MTAPSGTEPPAMPRALGALPATTAQSHPVWGFLAGSLCGGYLQTTFVGAHGYSLYVVLLAFFPAAAFLVVTAMSAVVLGITLGVVGGPLVLTNRFRFWPLLGGAVTLSTAIYVGLPLWLNPAVHRELPSFLTRSILEVAVIAAMVCCYWFVRRGTTAAVLLGRAGWAFGVALAAATIVFQYVDTYWWFGRFDDDLPALGSPFAAIGDVIRVIATSLIVGIALWHLLGTRLSSDTMLKRGLWHAGLGAAGTVLTATALIVTSWASFAVVAIVNNQPTFPKVLAELLLRVSWPTLLLCGAIAGSAFAHIAVRIGWVKKQPTAVAMKGRA